MKKTKLFNKLFGFVLAVVMMTTALTAGSVASAQAGQNSFLCAAFPCNGILGPGGTIDITSIVALVFRIILYAAVLWTIWNIVLAGIKIAGAKEDADKRKEGIQAVINAVIGLVVALLAFGIVSTVLGSFNANNSLDLSVPCTGFRTENGGIRVAKAGFRGTGDQAGICYEQNPDGSRGDALE
jgi:hypothetical protein